MAARLRIIWNIIRDRVNSQIVSCEMWTSFLSIVQEALFLLIILLRPATFSACGSRPTAYRLGDSVSGGYPTYCRTPSWRSDYSDGGFHLLAAYPWPSVELSWHSEPQSLPSVSRSVSAWHSAVGGAQPCCSYQYPLGGWSLIIRFIGVWIGRAPPWGDVLGFLFASTCCLLDFCSFLPSFSWCFWPLPPAPTNFSSFLPFWAGCCFH